MKIIEIIQRVQSLYSHGTPSDDSRLSNRLIYNKLLSARSFLITQDSKKNPNINPWNLQTIPCVELVKAPIHDCPCLPPVGCAILRTKYALPSPIHNNLITYIESVTSLDGRIVYTETTWKEKKYKSGNKYTSGIPDYFVRDNYLYITWSRGPRVITISGLFEDPIEVEMYPSLCQEERNDCDFDIMEIEFPIEDSLIEQLIALTIQELITQFNSSTQDIVNNTIEDERKHHQYPSQLSALQSPRQRPSGKTNLY